MKLIQKYINDDIIRGGYCYLNNDVKGKVIKDVKFLSFNRLYSRIILLFYTEGLINIPKDDAKKIEYYLELTKLDDNARIFINGYFGRCNFNIRNKISSYCYLMIEDIIKRNNNIIYADTDSIFYIGDNICLYGIDIPFEIAKIDYILFERIKYYLFCDKKMNEFKVKGPKRDNKINEYMSNIKREIRNDKLKLIL